MRNVRGLLISGFICTLLATPALAHEHSLENCDMHGMNASEVTGNPGHIHETHNVTVVVGVSAKEIPTVGANESNPCPFHTVMLDGSVVLLKISHCGMRDCCLKSGGPLSAGHKTKSIGQEEHLFVPTTILKQYDRQFLSFEPVVFHALEGNPTPIPRPPLA